MAVLCADLLERAHICHCEGRRPHGEDPPPPPLRSCLQCIAVALLCTHPLLCQQQRQSITSHSAAVWRCTAGKHKMSAPPCLPPSSAVAELLGHSDSLCDVGFGQVPYTQPARAFDMVTKFIQGMPL